MAMCSIGSVDEVMSRGLIVNWSFPVEDLSADRPDQVRVLVVPVEDHEGQARPGDLPHYHGRRSVDLPAPVMPSIATCRLRSSICSLKSWAVPERVRTLPRRMPPVPDSAALGT